MQNNITGAINSETRYSLAARASFVDHYSIKERKAIIERNNTNSIIESNNTNSIIESNNTK